MFSIMYCFNITLKGFSIPISVSTVQGIPPTTTLTWPLKDPRTWALHVHCFTFYEASLSMTTGSTLKVKGPEDVKTEMEGREDNVVVIAITVLHQDLFWE